MELLARITDLGAEGLSAMLFALRVLALVSIPSVIIERRGAPVAAVSWILALIVAPPIALPLWWTVGRRYLERRRRKRRRAKHELSAGLAGVRGKEAVDDGLGLVGLSRLPKVVVGQVFPATAGNRIALFATGEAAYDELARAIEGAREHVHFLYYIWEPDRVGTRFRDLLADAARRGVEVRALYDAIGSSGIRPAFVRPVLEAGGQVAEFLPPKLKVPGMGLNFRNHRKIVVVDGRVGFTGGMNVGEEYLGWRDLALAIEGPAVDQLQEVFADDWFFVTRRNLAEPRFFGRSPPVAGGLECAVVASGPDTRHNLMADVFFAAMNRARERIWLVTPYFIPDAPTLASLRSATYRGLDVRLLVPGESDVPVVRLASRAYYPELLELGVRIFEYKPSVLHAKAALFDADLGLVGSANVDTRSFRLNFEASVLVRGAEFVGRLEALVERDLEASREIHLAELARRGAGQRFIEATAHLFSPLL